MESSPPSIWLVNLFFGTGGAPTGYLLEGLAVHLEAAKFPVTVLTGRARYTTVGHSQARRFGGSVVDLGTDLSTTGIGRRFTAWFAFFLSVAWYSATHRLPDRVVVLTTPPYLHLLFAIRILFSRRRTKLILWNQDTYPEVLPAAGLLRAGSPVYRGLAWLNAWAMARTDVVVGLDEAMGEILLRCGARSVSVIPNWEVDEPETAEVTNHDLVSCLQHVKITYKYLVLYSGNYGWGHDIRPVLEYIRRHPDGRSFFFLFSGGGEKWNEVTEFKQDHPQSAMAVFPHTPLAELPSLIGQADLGLVTLERSCLGLLAPNKIHGYLYHRTPLLYLGPPGSNVDHAITAYDCGQRIDDGDVEGLERFLDLLEQGRHDLSRLRAGAARASRERYRENVGAAELARLITVQLPQ